MKLSEVGGYKWLFQSINLTQYPIIKIIISFISIVLKTLINIKWKTLDYPSSVQVKSL